MIEDDRERWMSMRIEVDDRRLKVTWYNSIVSGRGVSDVERDRRWEHTFGYVNDQDR